MRLIDADALKKEIADLVVGGEEGIAQGGDGNYWLDGIHSAYREIANAPTIEERTKGKWEYTRNGIIYCNQCSHYLGFKGNYCPNCGSYMRGEEMIQCDIRR